MPGRRGQSGCQVLGGLGARQARPLGRQGCQADEASQAVMCWGGRVPGRQGRQASRVARQARPVSPSCAGEAGYQAGKVVRQARPPGRQGAWQARLPGRRS